MARNVLSRFPATGPIATWTDRYVELRWPTVVAADGVGFASSSEATEAAMSDEFSPGHRPESSGPEFNRRLFLSTAGTAGIVAAVGAGEFVPPKQVFAETAPTEGALPVTLHVNGQQHQLQVDPRTTLLDCLREGLQLTGTKKGCDHGQCGACTVHVNSRRVNSCLSLAVMHEGDEITTIEGIGQPDKLHPMQKAFVECDGYQCGYCTSGQIMSAVALLKERCGRDDSDVKELMAGNICRCGAYPNIVAAIQQVRHDR
jgi:xanthine dehydrogenase YagT iron-sulfur-binding subunit